MKIFRYFLLKPQLFDLIIWFEHYNDAFKSHYIIICYPFNIFSLPRRQMHFSFPPNKKEKENNNNIFQYDYSQLQSIKIQFAINFVLLKIHFTDRINTTTTSHGKGNYEHFPTVFSLWNIDIIYTYFLCAFPN